MEDLHPPRRHRRAATDMQKIEPPGVRARIVPLWRCPFRCGGYYALPDLWKHLEWIHNTDHEGKALDDCGIQHDCRIWLTKEELEPLAVPALLYAAAHSQTSD